MSFPSTIDSFTNPASTDKRNSPSHALQHDNANNAINAIEVKIGVDSSAVVTTLDYLLKNAASVNPGHHHNNTSLDAIASSKITGQAFPSGDIVGTTDTQTISNKRRILRVLTVTTSATPTINTDNYDVVNITALNAAINTMTTNLSGTPNDKDILEFEIKDDGTPRAITWGASFVAGGVALPTTTVTSKILTVLFQYSTANSLNKWRCIASVQES